MTIINKEEIGEFRAALMAEDRTAGTVEKYLRDLAPFRPNLLPSVPGCGKAGGCAGTQQRGDDENSPHLHRGRAQPGVGALRPGQLAKRQN